MPGLTHFNATLMRMRKVAVLLIVSVLAPSVASALCNFTCGHGHSEAAQADASCHGHGTNHSRSLKSTDSPWCHDTRDDDRAAVVGSAPPLTPGLLVLPRTPVLTFEHLSSAVTIRDDGPGPPDILLISTQLRI
jgi:hypothetical protein